MQQQRCTWFLYMVLIKPGIFYITMDMINIYMSSKSCIKSQNRTWNMMMMICCDVPQCSAISSDEYYSTSFFDATELRKTEMSENNNGHLTVVKRFLLDTYPVWQWGHCLQAAEEYWVIWTQLSELKKQDRAAVRRRTVDFLCLTSVWFSHRLRWRWCSWWSWGFDLFSCR